MKSWIKDIETAFSDVEDADRKKTKAMLHWQMVGSFIYRF